MYKHIHIYIHIQIQPNYVYTSTLPTSSTADWSEHYQRYGHDWRRCAKIICAAKGLSTILILISFRYYFHAKGQDTIHFFILSLGMIDLAIPSLWPLTLDAATGKVGPHSERTGLDRAYDRSWHRWWILGGRHGNSAEGLKRLHVLQGLLMAVQKRSWICLETFVDNFYWTILVYFFLKFYQKSIDFLKK